MASGVEDFDAYVSARWARLVRTAVHLGCRADDAQDLVQRTLERAYRHWSKVVAARDPDAYVYRIMVNTDLKARRRKWRGEEATPLDQLDVEHVSDLGSEVSSRLSVTLVLRRLPTDQCTVVVLRYYADLSERQVADIVGIPLGTVKSRTARALDRLSTELGSARLTESQGEN